MKKRLLNIALSLCMIIGILGCIGCISSSAYTIGYDGLGPQKIEGKRDFQWPVPGYYNLQSCFYDTRNHCAIDISAPQGTKITAAYGGKVIKAVDKGSSYYGDGFGNYVVLQHIYTLLNGTSVTLYSRYSHMSSVSVSEGQQVSKGATLGKVGATGSAEGNHLDFQILYGGWAPYKTYSVDPYANYLLELPSNLQVYDSYYCGADYYQLIKNLYSKPVSKEPPSGQSVKTDKANYKVGETVTITPTAKNVDHYNISIYCGGKMVCSNYNGFTGSTTFVTTQEGTHVVYIDCINSYGTVQTSCSFTVGNVPHTCNKGEYLYYESLHPHYNDYRCSICGKIWHDTSSSNYVSSCISCNHSNSPVSVSNGYYVIESALNSGKVLDVAGGSMDKSANIQLYDKNSSSAQIFEIKKSGSSYSIFSNCSGLAVNVQGSSSKIGANVEQYTPNGNRSQCWTFEDAGDGYVYIKSALGSYLDVYNANTANGTNIEVYYFNGSKAQKFKLVQVKQSLAAYNNYSGKNYLVGSDFKTLDTSLWKSRNTSVATISVDSTNTHNGYNSLKIVNKSAGSTSSKDLSIITQAQPRCIVNETQNMVLSFWAKSSVDGAKLYSRWGYESDCRSVTLTTEWKQYSISMTKSSSFDQVLHPYVDRAATVWLAEMQLEDGSTPTAFVPESGGKFTSLTVSYGKSYTLPATLTRDGYTFDGWYSNAVGGTMFTTSTPVKAGEYRVYAHWTKDESTPVTPVPTYNGIHFPKVAAYTQGMFTDVPPSQWFTPNVAAAVEFGLMKGNSPTTFNPYGDVTLAEAITMAARIHSIYTTGSENFVQSGKWYQCYLDYAYQNGIISNTYYTCDVTQRATRAQFAEIFANAMPGDGLYPINSVGDNAVPDVKSSDACAPYVYKLYRAGILTGGDVKGTFSPLTYITRAECATIVARMADSDNRVAFTLN